MNIYNVSIQKNIKIKTRDGINLYTDIYFPSDDKYQSIKDLPILLERTPYDKKALNLTQRYNYFCERGYIVVAQDCRGCYASEGEIYFLTQEAEDGFDTLQWLETQDWYSGNIGTFGTSYQAWTQSAAATQNPKSLSAMIVNMGGSNAFTSSVRQGGAMELRFIAWAYWHSSLNTNSNLKDLNSDFVLNNFSFEKTLSNWPIKKGLTPLSLVPNYEQWAFDILTNSKYDEYWKHPGFAIDEYYDDHPDIPMIYVGGWYDSYTRATIENFENLSKLKKSEVKLLIGPWTHGTSQPELTYSGDLEFGPDATIGSFSDFHLAWYDKWFKNEKSDKYLYDSPIKIFVMGTGDGSKTKDGKLFHGGYWREEDTWPLQDTKFTNYYFSSDNQLLHESNKQKLNDNFSLTYIYDPSNPVPTIGANISSLSGLKPVPTNIKTPADVPAQSRRYNIVEPGGFNQVQEKRFYGTREPYAPLSARNDILSFQSDIMDNNTEITGPITATLFVSSDSPDTDFTAKLIDVYPPSKDFPNGFAFNLTDGILRMRFRESFTEEKFMNPNEIYEIKIVLYPTSNVFKKGHQIRIDLSSSNFPKFDYNPNTGEPIGLNKTEQIAKNTIHLSSKYQSFITLPIINRQK
mgnify:FL=1|tara:strand:+ start:948 stop:2837 length:1890 start_codon:yes stop_codon:yes gene_type:complete